MPVNSIEPKPGERWRSRDKRDDGLIVTVLDVANGYVRIQRFRKTTISLARFRRDYIGPLEEGGGDTEATRNTAATPGA